MRIIFFAGKGGVGKTSVAAATAVRAAESGRRTLVLSLDVAHSLADIFDLDRDLLDRNRGLPFAVHERLWIQELDIQEEIGRNWKDIHDYLSGLLHTAGLDGVLAEELAVFPGMEEISLLLHINQHVRSRRFDALLLDCAPTGESLRFIGLPATLDWYMEKVFRMERNLVRAVRPLARRLYDIPLPDERYFQAVEALCARLRGVDRLLTDPDLTTVRLVASPEKVVLKETQRAFMYFCLHRMCIDSVVLNRVLPEAADDGFFAAWRREQRGHLERAEELFRPVPIRTVELFEQEVIGWERLEKLADRLYGGEDPLDRFTREEPYRWVKRDGLYELRIRLPFAAREAIEVNRVADELLLRIGGYKRCILLPKKVAARGAVKAKMEDADLVLLFGKEDHG